MSRLNLEGRLVNYRFHMVRRLGSGTMGEVWLAEDIMLGRDVAVKFMTMRADNPAKDNDNRERFLREARSAAQISNPHAVTIHDINDGNVSFSDASGLMEGILGVPFIEMEYVPGGRTLKDEEKEQGRFTISQTVRVMGDVLDGLAAAHKADIIHRDIKPANIMNDSDTYMLTDFGLAKSTDSGVSQYETRVAGAPVVALPPGTVTYMPPEAFRNENTGFEKQGDVYAAGIVFWELVAGRNPVEGPGNESQWAGLMRRAQFAVPRLATVYDGVPVTFSDFVARLTAFEPSERPSDAVVALREFRELQARLTPVELAWRAPDDATLDEIRAAAEKEKTAAARPFSNIAKNITNGKTSEYAPDEEPTSPDTGESTFPAVSASDEAGEVATPAAVDPVPVDEAHFPDPVFRAAVAAAFDHDGDGILSEEEISGAVTFTCKGYLTLDEWCERKWGISAEEAGEYYRRYNEEMELDGYQYEEYSDYSDYEDDEEEREKPDEEKIRSVQGIEYLTALTSLDLEDNLLTSIDISHNVHLSKIDLASNSVTSLDTSHNARLATLNLSYNSVTSLDTSHNARLESLDLSHNSLTSLDTSHNARLESLAISHNNLTALDLTGCTELHSLTITDTPLLSIALPVGGKLESLEIVGTQLTSLDMSSNTEVKTLTVTDAPLLSIALPESDKLTSLTITGTKLTELDLSPCQRLVKLDLNHNQLTSIDLSYTTDVAEPDLSSNRLTSVTLGYNGGLKQLKLSHNRLTTLDVTRCRDLTRLYLDYNQFTENIDLSQNKKLTRLYMGNNQLTHFTAGIRKLSYLGLSSNQLIDVDVHGCPNLSYLALNGNPNLRQLVVAPGTDVSRMRTGLKPKQLAVLSIDEME